jgi:hypothetical protein
MASSLAQLLTEAYFVETLVRSGVAGSQCSLMQSLRKWMGSR